ncbi:MAG TPA: hypothetical protein PL126_02540 [Candidatus Cloacimonadota bacterium]|nr:hypothetical protein [Candidatus Cloacimonadota bacterium]
MKKIFKGVAITAAAALVTHFGYKTYKRISSVAKLSKSLPEFLKNVYGEAPKLAINRSFNTMTIRAGFSEETLEKHNDIEVTIREYVDDFYPDLSKCALDIDVYVLGDEEEEEEAEVEAEEDDEE